MGLVLLGLLSVPIPVRRLRVARWHVRRHKRRVRPHGEIIDPTFPVLDSRELVDLPSCVHLPNDWLRWFPCSWPFRLATASPTSSPSVALALSSTPSQMLSPRPQRRVLCCLSEFCLQDLQVLLLPSRQTLPSWLQHALRAGSSLVGFSSLAFCK